MVAGKDEGVGGEGFESLQGLIHLRIVAGGQIGASAIADEERIAGKKISLFLCLEQQAEFARAMARRMDHLEFIRRAGAKRNSIPVLDRANLGVICSGQSVQIQRVHMDR